MHKLGKKIGEGFDGKIYELVGNENMVVKYIQPKICGIDNYLESFILLHVKNQNLMCADKIIVSKNGVIKILLKKAIKDLRGVKVRKKHILLQIVNGLKILHNLNIIHGDIKPSNILLFENNNLKLNDFSLSRFTDSKSERQLYTQRYRPKEKIMTLKSDIFALGCTLYELYYGSPYLISSGGRLSHFKELWSGDSFLDLIYKMTSDDVEKRYSIEEVLCHPFFGEKDVKLGTICFDNYKNIMERWNNEIITKKCMNEILHECGDFRNIDVYVSEELNFNLFDYLLYE
jgi:serine/threonine protein kinase